MSKKLLGFVTGALLLTLSGIGFAADASFVGSKGSDKYHVPTCNIAKQIKPDNLVNFASEAEAAKAGYSPCKICIKADLSKPAFIGSKDSDKFHMPTCKMAAKIKAENQVGFASKEEAEKAGYKPCQMCMPSADKAKK